MKILGIETSCDETSASVVEDGHKLLSLVTASSADLHMEFGGVVPEIASRSHVEEINPVISRALKEAKTKWGQIDKIAYTKEPGLSGSLLIGEMTAKTFAKLFNKPLIPVNHVLAHPFAAFITKSSDRLTTTYQLPTTQPEFPILALIVSGGHTQITLFRSANSHEIIGKTTDDAVGEAYDKVAKILGLPYPGGPSIEKLAKAGDPTKYKLPKARSRVQATNVDAMQGNKEKRASRTNGTLSESHTQLTQQSATSSNSVVSSADHQVRAIRGLGKYDFSYSGLKTAVLRLAQSEIGEDYTFPSYKLSERLTNTQKADISACFNQVALETLVDKLKIAIDEFSPKSIVVAGGVSASPTLRLMVDKRVDQNVYFPDPLLCTDNGAMIATTAFHVKRK